MKTKFKVEAGLLAAAEARHAELSAPRIRCGDTIRTSSGRRWVVALLRTIANVPGMVDGRHALLIRDDGDDLLSTFQHEDDVFMGWTPATPFKRFDKLIVMGERMLVRNPDHELFIIFEAPDGSFETLHRWEACLARLVGRHISPLAAAMRRAEPSEV